MTRSPQASTRRIDWLMGVLAGTLIMALADVADAWHWPSYVAFLSLPLLGGIGKLYFILTRQDEAVR